ncbi:MAG: DUF4190 domain-containing protein, partial [Hyphomicrobiales bacterium]|nr:DUF4190 domain-containing protein [Hyphomicrobiales bacterium]
WWLASDGKWYPPQSAPALPPSQPGMVPGAAPSSNSKAIWSLVLGVLGIVSCYIFTGIPAIFLGGRAKKEIRAAGGMQEGASLATAGIVLGWISVAITGLVLVVVLTFGLLGESSPSSFTSVGTSIDGS